MSRPSGYGQVVIDALRRGEANAAAHAADWMEASLTDAALDGCHHCGERDPGEPCWWCGLKTEAESEKGAPTRLVKALADEQGRKDE